MIQPKKQILLKKLEKIAIKLKSYAFMKIFLLESNLPILSQKVRHYDLELEGASSIASWLKFKIQQVYLKHFYQIKEWKKSSKASRSSNYMNNLNQSRQSSENLKSFRIPNISNKNRTERSRCQTDRKVFGVKNSQRKFKATDIERKPCKSQFGEQSQLSRNSRKSNLQFLLKKVRQVNTQSRIDKQNQQRSNNSLQSPLNKQNKVLSTQTQETQNKIIKKKHYSGLNQNSSRFCKIDFNNKRDYYLDQMIPNRNLRILETEANSPRTRRCFNLDQEVTLDKNNLMSLKKWHRNQKRGEIINKIKQLQNSLLYNYSDQLRHLENDQENSYPFAFQSCELPANYTFAYPSIQFREPSKRSALNFKMRK